MNARPLSPLIALSAALVVGCGSSPPSGRTAEGVAPIAPAATVRQTARSPRDSAVQFETARSGARGLGQTDGDGDNVRPDVQAVRDRVMAQADLFEDAPSGRRAPARKPTNLNDRTMDEQSESAEIPPASPSAAGKPSAAAVRPVPRDAVRRPPSAVPLAQAPAAIPTTAVPVPPNPPAAPAPPAVAGPVGPSAAGQLTDGSSTLGASRVGKTEVAVGGAELSGAAGATGGTGAAEGPAAAGGGAGDVRLHGNGNPPVEVTVYGNSSTDLEKRLADKAKDAPQDPAAQFDYQLFQLLKTDVTAPLPPNAALSKEDRNLLATLAAGMANIRAGLAGDANPPMSEKVRPILELAEQVRGQADMTIPTVELCKEVRGFGQYDPMPHKFLAGTDHRVIVYSEVQNFTSRPTQGQFWETKLSLEVTLAMNDGTIIWNDKNNVPVDVSRNRRHDFFLIKHMQLPKTLAVGKYILKVSVTDEHAKRVAEFSSDITMTAQ